VLRVTTLYASSATATAAYYTRYLADAPGEVPGVWTGQQATALGLTGRVEADDLQALLEGRDPTSGMTLGSRLVDRVTSDGRTIRAVAGFDATFSAPKSVSVWWGLTGERGVLDAHDVAVAAVLAHVERFGATTRIRVNGHRAHPDSRGLIGATFRQTTSRADDPQLHTHAVISAKVQTTDGRWLALDARYVKRNQRMLGGLYQSVLRSELTDRYGIGWEPIVNGQAEITGMPAELLEVFSKRAAQVDIALQAKVEEFRDREGRDPTTWERAAMTREASADTRAHKTGQPATDLTTRWLGEAAELSWTPGRVVAELTAVSRDRSPGAPRVAVDEVLDELSARGSTWNRADILRAVCDLQPPVPGMAERWAAALDRACDQVVDACHNLDPETDDRGPRRGSDGRSVWLEPVSGHLTSSWILAEEEGILCWAMDTQADPPTRSTTVNRDGLDVLQADAAAAVAGVDRLVVVVGPAGTGKTTMLRRAVDDLHDHHRPVHGLAPTAKAARVLESEAGIPAETVAKLLYEWGRTDRPPDPLFQLPESTTLIVDEAGIIGTSSLHRLIELAVRNDWRLVLVGDPRQLQAVGRGGLFAELCASSRVYPLARIHRFHHPWEAAASLQLRAGDPKAIDAYQSHRRIIPGRFDEHVTRIARDWMKHTSTGKTVAITAATNVHVDTINYAIQRARLYAGHLADSSVAIGGDEQARVGDAVVTRRNDRTITTSTGEPVRNRDRWTVTALQPDGGLTVAHLGRTGSVTLPADYTAQHVRLGYAATEHGNQADTVDIGINLISTATTQRGLYVGMTRGRDENRLLVVTDTVDLSEARDVIEGVLVHDRADVPAVTQRRNLHQQLPSVAPRTTLEPRVAIPGWFGPWRTGMEHHRDDLMAEFAERARRSTQATNDLDALQPALAAARTAWKPYQEPIERLEHELESTLRPAMYKANHEARDARLGHRHSTARQAAEATRQVTDAEARITAIRNEGEPVKKRLDNVEDKARTLRRMADHPAGLDRFDRQLLRSVGRLLDAADTYTAWARGQPTPTDQVTDAVAELIHQARRAHYHPLGSDEISQGQWADLLEPAYELLRDHGLETKVGRRLELERRGPDLGLGL
jgi:conjugative relaxase-like TrwC/TraI family protein